MAQVNLYRRKLVLESFSKKCKILNARLAGTGAKLLLMFPSTNSRSLPSQGGNIGANPFGNKKKLTKNLKFVIIFV